MRSITRIIAGAASASALLLAPAAFAGEAASLPMHGDRHGRADGNCACTMAHQADGATACVSRAERERQAPQKASSTPETPRFTDQG